MPNGTGTSIKGRQVLTAIGTTIPTQVFVRLTGAEKTEYRRTGHIAIEVFSPLSNTSHSVEDKAIWFGGAGWRFAAARTVFSTQQALIVVYWKEAGMAYEWFHG